MNGRKIPPTGAELHRAWLELVEADGPFLAVPALKRVWPQGMPQPVGKELAAVRDARPAFEKAWDRWDSNRDDKAAVEDYRQARDAWVNVILRDVFGWKTAYVTTADAAATANPTAAQALAAQVRSPDRSVTVRPTGALVHRDTVGALVLVIDPVDSLRDPLADGWAASPIDRMELLLRKADVKIGVVTDGCWWAIVSARPQTMLASGITSALTWTESPATRNAFIELLRRIRLIGGTPEDRLTELFKDSVAAAEEITEALGTQVRRAVELLVQALSEGALDARRHGHPDPLPADRDQVYQAAVTVLMRLVFLLFAEERGLLPQGALFTAGYGISDVLDDLDERVNEEGIEALDATHLTWHRLLATSQALYEGATFEDVTLPSYGGSLFDPARYPFLTACDPHGTLAITVSDRVMVEALRAVQVARLRGQPARRISFRDIDVEQIGYIYEGLLGYSCANVTEVTIGLIGKEGEEPEIPLSALEALRAGKPADAAFADAILTWVKEHQAGATPPTKAALAKALKDQKEQIQIEDAERTLRSLTTDPVLRDRLRPFIGIIRRDLRNRPLVVVRGGVLVVETPSRATAGAHYTPKSLAEDVVKYALEPLVYDPGPHQRVNGWVPVDSDRILDLKVADIACGSGAFLVAAARYLADRLVEAWQREKAVTGVPPNQLKTHAIRTVIASCLYGADINAMAVEMCKLSLWLVSLDPKLPFSFVDDKILHGNALLGLTDVRQLKRQHIDPDSVGVWKQGSIFELDVDGTLRRATRLRQQLATEVNDNDPQRSAATKRRLWKSYQELTAQLVDVADGVIAAGLNLGGKPGRALNAAYENLSIAVDEAYDTEKPNRTMLDSILKAGLTPTVATDYDRWKPLHWILAVPDVMERGGFDAIIGNPPFLGDAKSTAAIGANFREWLAQTMASGRRGKADLVAFFFLRAFALTPKGNLGLIATNTIAQGDTREVGLDQMVAKGFTITRAIQSQSWPAASANLEYAAVWGTCDTVSAAIRPISDGMPVRRISSILEPAGKVDGNPIRLRENVSIAFGGLKPYGAGFILSPDEARGFMDADRRNSEVLFPFLNGEDVNSRPDSSAPRWVIDFNDFSLEKASEYGLPYQRLLQLVKPEREIKSKAVREAPWWLFFRSRPALRKAIRGLSEVLVITVVSRTVMPVRLPTGQVFSHALTVFATDSYVDQAVLSSSLHQMWAIKYGSGMRNDPRYTPSDVFETFPRPTSTDGLAEVGRTLDTERREIMLRRGLGLTKLYNLVNDPATAHSVDSDIARLRQIHVELDQAVMDAYGWSDVNLDHGFHTYRQMTRWTLSPAARVEILDRLLEENHRRAAAQGEALPPADDPDQGDDE